MDVNFNLTRTQSSKVYKTKEGDCKLNDFKIQLQDMPFSKGSD